jgi:hypothetical protein
MGPSGVEAGQRQGRAGDGEDVGDPLTDEADVTGPTGERRAALERRIWRQVAEVRFCFRD